MNMNRKKILALSPVIALLCIVALTGVANAAYASTLIDSGPYNGGGLLNPSGVLGSTYDGNNAIMTGASAGKGAYVIVQMSSSQIPAYTSVEVYASRYTQYTNSAIHVYVSDNSNGPWYEATNSPWIPGSSYSWGNFIATHTFTYVKVEGWGSGQETVYIDSIITM
jgi:hypothetical protein